MDLIITMIEKYNSLVRLYGEDGMEASHKFFLRLLTKDGWLDDFVSID